MKEETLSRRKAIKLAGLGAASAVGLAAAPGSAFAEARKNLELTKRLGSMDGLATAAIYDRWRELGGEYSYLGLPTSGVSMGEDSLYSCRFEFGTISYDPSAEVAASDAPEEVSKRVEIVTPPGTALRGFVVMTLKSNGDWGVAFHMHDSGAPGYDFSVHAFWKGGGVTVAAHDRGHVDGTSKVFKIRRDSDRNSTGNSASIRHYWKELRGGSLSVAKDYSATGVIGAIQDLAKLVLDVGAGTVGEGLGVVIGIGEGFDLVLRDLNVHLKIGGTMGVLSGVVVCAFGGGFLLAAVAGAGSTAAMNQMVRSKPLTPAEWAFCNQVFQGKLPTNIRITNLHSINNRAFTFKGVDGITYLNMGPGYNSPSTYRDGSYPAPGQMLIHEATHAWQIEHNPNFWIPGLVCKGLVNQANNSFVQDVYRYGAPNVPWSRINLEAQAAIVDQWFGGYAVDSAPNRKLNMGGATLDTNDPYFHYIRDNIRRGFEG